MSTAAQNESSIFGEASDKMPGILSNSQIPTITPNGLQVVLSASGHWITLCQIISTTQ